MVIVDKQVTTQTLRPDNIVGASFPIFYSASGKAFLAFSEEPYIEETLRKIRTDTWPPISDQAYAAFLRELEDVRKTGLGYDYEELFPGVRCIAVPVFDRSEKAVAAVSVTAPTTRLTRQTTEKSSAPCSRPAGIFRCAWARTILCSGAWRISHVLRLFRT